MQFLKHVDSQDDIHQVAAEAIQLVRDDQLELTALGIFQESLKVGPLRVFTTPSAITVYGNDLMTISLAPAPHDLELLSDGCFVLVFGTKSAVKGDSHTGCLLPCPRLDRLRGIQRG